MASLFDVVNRRKKAKEWADRFREGASPDELQYLDRFYQEPTSSPVMQRGALEGELDMVDAIQRQLMARGMNALQAKDAAERTLEQQETATTKRAKDYATIYGPGGAAEGSKGGFKAYQEGLKPDPSSVGWGIHPDDRDIGLPLEDWARQKALQQGMAGDVSAAAKAQYEQETVDDRIEKLRLEVDNLPALINSKVVDAEVGSMALNQVKKHLADVVDLQNGPQSIQIGNQTVSADSLITDKINKANQIMQVLDKSTSTTAPGFGPSQFVDDELKQVLNQQGGGARTEAQSGQQFVIPTTEKVEGEYPR